MIISKKFNFIFLKSFKCQTENFMSKISYLLDENDFVSKTNYKLNKIRNQKVNCYGHNFFINPHNIKVNYKQTLINLIKNIVLFRGFKNFTEYKSKINQHDSIENLLKIIDPNIFNTYKKFIFFRDFEEVILSLYRDKEYRNVLKKKNIISFDDFFAKNCEYWFNQYVSTFSYKNKIYCDFILPYNNLYKSYDFLIENFNLGCERTYFIKSKINKGLEENIVINNSQKQFINTLKSNSVLNQKEFYEKFI